MPPAEQPQPAPTPTPEPTPMPTPTIEPVIAPAPEQASVEVSAQDTSLQQPVTPVQVIVNNPVVGAVPLKERSQAVALVLSIFLGTLGIDRFYLGSIGLGILKLLTAGLFGILWIIDIILIATKNIKGVTWK